MSKIKVKIRFLERTLSAYAVKTGRFLARESELGLELEDFWLEQREILMAAFSPLDTQAEQPYKDISSSAVGYQSQSHVVPEQAEDWVLIAKEWQEVWDTYNDLFTTKNNNTCHSPSISSLLREKCRIFAV